MPLTINNLEEVLNNVDMFCQDKFDQVHDVLYPVIEGDKTCSFNSNDRR